MRDIIIQAVTFAIASAIFIPQGLRILTAKRPFIVSPRRMVIFELAPSMAILIWALWPNHPAQGWLHTLQIWGIFLAFGGMAISWGIILSRGYLVVGATGTVLHDALRRAINKLNLPYEESAQSFRLPTLNNELVTEATLINGMFRFRLKRKRFRNRRTIRQLAAEIKDLFSDAPALTNRRMGYALVMIGAAVLLLGSWLTYRRLSLESEIRATRVAHTEFFKSSEK